MASTPPQECLGRLPALPGPQGGGREVQAVQGGGWGEPNSRPARRDRQPLEARPAPSHRIIFTGAWKWVKLPSLELLAPQALRPSPLRHCPPPVPHPKQALSQRLQTTSFVAEPSLWCMVGWQQPSLQKLDPMLGSCIQASSIAVAPLLLPLLHPILHC